jgi:DNA-binding NtrC family response regulator
LRERVDDVPLLLDYYLRHFAKENNVTAPRLSAGALTVLQRYNWPGNVRELRNFCENAVVLKRGGEISEYDLDPKFTAPAAAIAPGNNLGPSNPLPLANSLPTGGTAAPNPLSKEANEKRLLRAALVEARGNRTQAAQLMGISRRTLHRKLAEWPELDVGN